MPVDLKSNAVLPQQPPIEQSGRRGFSDTVGEIASDVGVVARTIVTTNWAGAVHDVFDRALGKTPPPRAPDVFGARAPSPETVKQADDILARSRKSMFLRLPQLVREEGASLQYYPRAVLDEITKLPPDSPVIEQVMSRIDPLCQKHLVEMMDIDFLKKMSLPAREIAMDLAAHCITVAADKAVYDALAPGVHDDKLVMQLNQLADPQSAAALKAQLSSLGDESSVSYRGVSIDVDKPAEHQPLFDPIYTAVEKIANQETTPVDVAMAKPLSKSDVTGKTAHFDGTTLFRPGLGNIAPSAASLFRMGQYCDKLVLAYECTDGTDASKLRPLTEYKGVPVPPELQGKLFAVGSPDHRLQDGKRGAGVFIDQLNQLATGGARYGLQSDHLNVVAHSQGNIETVLARATLAAHGFPDVITQHNALAPALRGSFFADNELVVGQGELVGGHVGADAIRHLQPDWAEANVPELMRKTVDTAFFGTVQTDKKPAFWSLLMNIGDIATNKDLAGAGSDGLVDERVHDFVKSPENFHQSATAFDHFSIVTDPAAIDEMMTHQSPKDPAALEVLHRIAEA